MIKGYLTTEGVIKEDYPEKLKAQIASLPADVELIIHRISSPGGNVYAAWKAIPELLKIGKPIHVEVEGEASSIASWLMLAGATSIKTSDPATFMVHEPFFPEGLGGALGVDDLKNAQVELSQIGQSMAEAYAKKSGRPVQEWLDIMKKKTRFTAKMARDYGLVDEVLPTEPRRIAAEFMEEIREEMKETFATIKEEAMNLFGKNAKKVVANATAIDMDLKDGKKLHVESETGDLIGKPATVDGVAAEGTYELNDGRMVVCVGGKVTEVKNAAPQETAEQKLQKQLADVQGQLSALKLQEEAKLKAEEAEKVAAEAKLKAEEATKALEDAQNKAAALAEENEKLKKQTVGPDGNPDTNISATRQPAAMSTAKPNLELMATRTKLADALPWLERFYKDGKLTKEGNGNGRYADGTTFNSYSSIGGPNAVSILETNLNYTWNGVLSLDLFFKPTMGSPALSDIFTIDLGASDKKRYHIAPVANKVLKPYTGCGQAVTGTALDITSKYIQLKPFEMYESWCKDDFTDQLTGSYNVLAQEWLKTGTDSFDPAGTPIDRMIVQLLKDSLRRDIFRRVSFGDTTSSSADWNQIDGLWQSLIDQSGASNYCVYREGAALGVGTLAAGTALTYFTNIYNNSSNLLKQEGIDGQKGRFLVTRSVWENYYTSLAANGAVTEQAFKNLVDGAGNLTFRGIPVIPVGIWDDQLADATNPLAATTKHLIAFTIKGNHILGVENTADLGKIDSWFEKKDNKRYYRSNMIMGFLGAIHCELTTISY